jgi:hypothetical protein
MESKTMTMFDEQWREIMNHLRGLSEPPPRRQPYTPRHEPHEPSTVIKQYAEAKFRRRRTQHKEG